MVNGHLGANRRRIGLVQGLRAVRLPDTLAALCDDPDAKLSSDDRSRLRALLPTYADWCAELESMGIDSSLQHDDLHDGNVFVGAGGDRIFDWGDSSVAHPFGTLLVTFRSVANRGLGDETASTRALDRLRDAYLEPWTAEHSSGELTRAVALAMRVAIVGRSLSWKRALGGIPMDDRGEWADAVGWLADGAIRAEPRLIRSCWRRRGTSLRRVRSPPCRTGKSSSRRALVP